MDMKCIKTGCDIICDNILYHGDLMYRNGVLVLSGVPNESWQNIFYLQKGGENVFYHFKSGNMAMIPGTGCQYAAFLVEFPFDVQKDFIDQIKKWETPECVALFEENK